MMDDRLIGLGFLFLGLYAAVHNFSYSGLFLLLGMIYFIFGEWKLRWRDFLNEKDRNSF
jgi:hypothetical protein